MASALHQAPDSLATTPPPSSTKHPVIFTSHPVTSKSSSTSSTPSPPFVHVEGVPNFRDLGGYPCHPPSSHFSPHLSYTTRPFTVFRSAQLTDITSRGAETLAKELKIRRLYDLRSQREINTLFRDTTPANITGVERVFVPVFRDQDYSPEGLAKRVKNYTGPDDDASHGYSAGFVRAYRDILLNAGPAYRRIFEHLRDFDITDEAGGSRPEPLLFHCAAGKDRTGVLAALVLRLCGVPDEVIAWEYSITKMGLGSWSEVIIAHMMKGGEPGSGTRAMRREEAERAVGSRKRNMTVFLNEVVDREWGGVENYMKEQCHLSADDVEMIRSRLVVEGQSKFGDGAGYWRPSHFPDADEKGPPLGVANDSENAQEKGSEGSLIG